MSQLPLPDGLLLAALAVAAAAGWVGTGGSPAHRLPRLMGDPRPRQPPLWAVPVVGERLTEPAAGGAGAAQFRRLSVACVPLAVLVGSVSGSVVAGLLVLAAGAALVRQQRARSRARGQAERRAAVLALCTVMVAELRAGRGPRDALAWAAGSGDVGSGLGRLRTAVTYDCDVPTMLREMAAWPGAHGLRRLAACWRVAERSGAGLAAAVERLANGLRAEEAQRREVSAQLAGPRATARLVAVLPLFGLMLAAGLGGDPLGVLFGTSYGLVCLGTGLALDVVGVLWTERIASAAERVS